MRKEEDITLLLDAFSKLKNVEEVKAFFLDILTESEQKTLVKRLKVARMLEDGTAYKEIEKVTGASSATIAKVSEYLKYGYDGYRVVLDRLNKKN